MGQTPPPPPPFYTAVGGLSPPPLMGGGSHETVIQFTHQEEQPWESEEEESDTSTPDCKRGRHHNPGKPAPVNMKPALSKEQLLTRQAVREISQFGLEFRIPQWISNRRWSTPSLLLLADAQLSIGQQTSTVKWSSGTGPSGIGLRPSSWGRSGFTHIL